MSYISYEKYGPEYQKLWDTMKIIRDVAELQRRAGLRSRSDPDGERWSA